MKWQGRVARKKRGFKEKKRTAKEEKAFQEQLAIDRQNFHISVRTNLVRDATFLISQAIHRLGRTWEHFETGKGNDFDDLNHNIHYAESFLEFAQEQLAEISDRDYEYGVHPTQRKEKVNGRRKRDGSGKKRTKEQKGKG